MPHFFTYAEGGPAQLTGFSYGSWDTSFDLTDDANYVGSAPTFSNATGIILRIVGATSTDYSFAVRKPGSSTDRYRDLQSGSATTQRSIYVGCDSTPAIDIKIENAALEVYVIGYFTDEAAFFTDGNQYSWQASSANVWESKDLSSYLSAGAKFAVLEIQASTSSGYAKLGFRYNGSADDREPTGGQSHIFLIVPVDDNGYVEYYAGSTASMYFYLVGEITEGTVETSGADVSLGSTGSYQTVDLTDGGSVTVPSNAVFAVVEIYSADLDTLWAAKRYGDNASYDLYSEMDWGTVYLITDFALFPVLDASDDSNNERCSAKISNTAVDFYLWGFITAPAAGGANDFSQDSNCKALWKFETGALLTDSIGSNDLTNVSCSSDGTYYMEGSYSAKCDQHDYMYIADTNLDAGFPYKYGDSNGEITVCFWARALRTYDGTLISKYEASGDKRCFRIRLLSDGTLTLYLGYSSGASYETHDHGSTFPADTWQHITFSFSESASANGTYALRVRDASGDLVGTDLEAEADNSGVLADTTAQFQINGYEGDNQAQLVYIDEVVVFNRAISAAEATLIAQGAFPEASLAILPLVMNSYRQRRV